MPLAKKLNTCIIDGIGFLSKNFLEQLTKKHYTTNNDGNKIHVLLMVSDNFQRIS